MQHEKKPGAFLGLIKLEPVTTGSELYEVPPWLEEPGLVLI